MFVLLSIATTLVVILIGIEAANCVAYGHFACRRHETHIRLELENSSLHPCDFEIIRCHYGLITVVPLSLLSDFYYSDDSGCKLRILRFTKLHKEIQTKFQELQRS